ncbi:MAG: lytic transglycosylase domain-containing protein [Acidobacteriota bacterium]
MSGSIPEAESGRRRFGRRGGRGRRVPALGRMLTFVGGLAAMTLGTPALAELVLFRGGEFLRVESVEVQDEKVRLGLPGGGLLAVPLQRVERILDDRVSAEPAPEAPADFALHFAGQQAPAVPYGDLMLAAGERHGINPELLAAVARAESAYRPDAVSPKGARGLMQLMPATAERFGMRPEQAFDPRLALDAGARYLKWLARRFDDDLTHVLAAYNAGEGTVDRYRGVPPYRETRNYIRRIFAHLGLDPAPALANDGAAAPS